MGGSGGSTIGALGVFEYSPFITHPSRSPFFETVVTLLGGEAMRFVRFVCLFAILLSMLVLAQSNRAPVVNQPNGLPTAQQRQPGISPNLPRMPQGAPFAQHGTRALNATGNRRRASPLQGGLNFAPVVLYGSGGFENDGPVSVAVADVNGDGKPDLLVTNVCESSSNCNNGTIGVLLGNGDGTFQTAVPYGSGGYEPYSVAVADVNGDGKPDLLVANWCASSNPNNCSNGEVGVLLGNGDGTFQTAVTYSSGGFFADSVAAADVNRDGKPDLLVANTGGVPSCLSSSGVGVLLGNGDGTFQTAVTYCSGGNRRFCSSGRCKRRRQARLGGGGNKYNADNCNHSGCVSVLLGNGDGTFQTAVSYDSGGYPPDSVAVADVNRDGKPDILVANYCGDGNCDITGNVGVLLGNGDGTFQTVVTYDVGGSQLLWRWGT